jgi:HEAT repeat protein
MKIILLFALTLPLFAGDLERFLDIKSNYTMRNEACLALRGDAGADVIAAMRAALENAQLQACAGANLRVAGAEQELLDALSGSDPTARAVAARELGTMQKPEFLTPLRKAVEDKDILVASNAIEGLVRYDDHSSAPQLRETALMGGVLTALTLDTLIDWRDPEVLTIGRKLIARDAPGDRLAGIRAIGLTGEASDLPKLRALAKDDAALASGGRGFGLMPAISISRAAKTAIQSITGRNGFAPGAGGEHPIP